MTTGKNAAPKMHPEEKWRGLRLLRTCDALELIHWAFEEAVRRGDLGEGDDDVRNARDKLRILRETADAEFLEFKRRHGITH